METHRIALILLLCSWADVGGGAGDPDQHAVPGAADRRRHQRQHRHQRLQQPDLILF